MKTISIRIQKIIAFIPIINPVIFFIWIYNFIRIQESLSVLLKSLLIVWGVLLACSAVNFGCQLIFSETSIISMVVNAIMLYIAPLLMGISLIKYQEDYIF